MCRVRRSVAYAFHHQVHGGKRSGGGPRHRAILPRSRSSLKRQRSVNHDLFTTCDTTLPPGYLSISFAWKFPVKYPFCCWYMCVSASSKRTIAFANAEHNSSEMIVWQIGFMSTHTHTHQLQTASNLLLMLLFVLWIQARNKTTCSNSHDSHAFFYHRCYCCFNSRVKRIKVYCSLSKSQNFSDVHKSPDAMPIKTSNEPNFSRQSIFRLCSVWLCLQVCKIISFKLFRTDEQAQVQIIDSRTWNNGCVLKSFYQMLLFR